MQSVYKAHYHWVEFIMANESPKSVAEYERQKKLAKEQDARDLQSGAKSASDLKRENEHFAGLRAIIDFSRLKSPD